MTQPMQIIQSGWAYSDSGDIHQMTPEEIEMSLRPRSETAAQQEKIWRDIDDPTITQSVVVIHPQDDRAALNPHGYSQVASDDQVDVKVDENNPAAFVPSVPAQRTSSASCCNWKVVTMSALSAISFAAIGAFVYLDKIQTR